MYHPDTIELAQEMGLDPEDFSASDPFADDSGVSFRKRNQYDRSTHPSQYDDFQDDIGDYMRTICYKTMNI